MLHDMRSAVPHDPPLDGVDYGRRHLRAGWIALAVFATAGVALELLHGFKIRAYLDVSNESRRLMWTLAHAHGTLLAVLNLVFGLTLRVVPGFGAPRLRMISSSLIGALIILPAGFFLGGVIVYGGDPGLGIVLVPIGAALLLTALVFAALSSFSTTPDGPVRAASDRRGQAMSKTR
jgi:hypothetical protein